MDIEKIASLAVKRLLEDDEADDLKDVVLPPDHTAGIHDDLMKALSRLGISGEQIITRDSDVYVMCRSSSEAVMIKNAGPWKSMAEVVRTNPEHPDARQYPWLCDIPFANLAGLIASKLR